MKHRVGFVSNSSTSSFILLIPKDIHEQVVSKLHPYVQAILKGRTGFHQMQGKNYVSIGYVIDMGGNSSWDYVDDYIEYEGEIPRGACGEKIDMYEIVDKYEKDVNKIDKSLPLRIDCEL